MNLVFVSEARFEKGRDGKIYSPDGSFNCSLWERYLVVFDKLYIVGRVAQTDNEYSLSLIAESDKVTFIEVPCYFGPWQYLKNRKAIKSKLKEAIILDASYILRIPGNLGRILSGILLKQKIPYAVEVVGDPWDVFAFGGGIKHPLRSFFRVQGYLNLRFVVKNACAVLYVTKQKLQNRYPATDGVYTTFASNVILPDEKLNKHSKFFQKAKGERVDIISVGSLAQMYKAPDVVVDAIRILRAKGWNCHLTWLGEGIYREQMIDYAKSLGLADCVNFVGAVPSGDGVRDKLAEADLFILASRTEGLPRALIEAMGSGLPCVGTGVGGIPELLDSNAIVEKNNALELAHKIEEFLSDSLLMNEQAARNFNEARNYVESLLTEKRILFYNYIKSITLK